MRNRLVGTLIAVVVAGCGAALADAPVWNRPAFATEPRALLEQVEKFPEDAEAGVVVVLLEVEFTVSEDGRVDQRFHSIYRIVSAGAVASYSSISVPWRPGFQARPEVTARVVAADGTPHDLDAASLRSYSASEAGPTVYGDLERLSGPLPGVDVGAVIEFEYTVRDEKPFYPGGLVERFPFAGAVAVQGIRLIADVPKQLSFTYVTRLLPDVEVKTSSKKGRKRYVFEQGPRAAWEQGEPNAPGDVPRVPFVGFSTASSWGNVAATYAAIVEERIVGADVKKKVRKLAARSETRSELVSTLLAELHDEVRYTGVEFGLQAIIPARPDDTLKRRFGDCKDKAALLIAMLREAGIEARMALLFAGSGEDLDPDLPGLGAFNHAIVYVPGPEPLWIDATAHHARLGELPIGDQGRLALVADPATTDLTTIPMLDETSNRVVETREVYLRSREGARIVETTEWHGEYERINRAVFGQMKRSEIREELESYAQNNYSSDELLDFELSDTEDLSTPLTLRIEVEGAGVAWTAPPRATVYVPLGPLLEDIPEELQTEPDTPDPDEPGGAAVAAHDVIVPVPHVKKWNYEIHPLPGYVVRDLPEDESRAFGPAVLSSRFAVDDSGVIRASFRFESQARYTPEEASAVRESVTDFYEENAFELLIEQKGEILLAEGRIREALEEFRKLAEAAPKDAMPRSQIARTLLMAGFGAEARAEAQRAVNLEPKSVDARRTLGIVLAHDELGRKWHLGFDPDGAEAAFRKAIELDNDELESRLELTSLFEHDRNGVYLADGARLEEAVEIYETLRDDFEVQDFDDQLLIVLFSLERFSEVEALAEESRTAQRGGLMRVAAKAVEDPAAGIREASRLTGGGPQYRELLGNAAEFLLSVRRYEACAALMRAAAKGHPDAMTLLTLADTLGRTQRHDQPVTKTDTPEGLFRALMWGIMSAEDVAQAIEWMAADSIKSALAQDASDGNAAQAAWGRTRAAMITEIGSMNLILDLVLSHLKVSVTGSDSLGYRITGLADTPFNDEQSATIIYAVKEDAGYRVVANNTAPALAGLQILRWVDEENVEAARTWLDWIYDDVMGTPLAFPLIAFWHEGQEATTEEIRAAAAALLVQLPNLADEAIPILEALRETTEDDERNVIEMTLLQARMVAGDAERIVELAQTTLEAMPEAEPPFYALVGAHLKLEEWDEAQAVIVARKARFSDGDVPAKRMAASLASARDDHATHRRILGELIASGDATPIDYNNTAWVDIVLEQVTDTTLQYAQRAAAAGGAGSTAAIHTLATVYAEMDRPAEARDVLLQVVASRLSDSVEPIDAYVLGRIAESYGLIDVAREAYEQVEPDPSEIATSTGSTLALAQRRLSSLDAAPVAANE